MEHRGADLDRRGSHAGDQRVHGIGTQRQTLENVRPSPEPAVHQHRYRQVANVMEQNQKLRAARDLLLPRLMSGEIVV